MNLSTEIKQLLHEEVKVNLICGMGRCVCLFRVAVVNLIPYLQENRAEARLWLLTSLTQVPTSAVDDKADRILQASGLAEERRGDRVGCDSCRQLLEYFCEEAPSDAATVLFQDPKVARRFFEGLRAVSQAAVLCDAHP